MLMIVLTMVLVIGNLRMIIQMIKVFGNDYDCSRLLLPML